MPLVNQRIRLLATIGLTLLLNACSEDSIADYPEDDPEYNYNVDTVYREGEIYTEWFVWDEGDPYTITNHAGDLMSINCRLTTRLNKDSEFRPTIPTEGTGSNWYYNGNRRPYYYVVAKLQYKCTAWNNAYCHGIITGIERPWQYAYGQYEIVDGENNSIHGHIFRIFELYDELPE